MLLAVCKSRSLRYLLFEIEISLKGFDCVSENKEEKDYYAHNYFISIFGQELFHHKLNYAFSAHK
jgi:hypothetical protein